MADTCPALQSPSLPGPILAHFPLLFPQIYRRLISGAILAIVLPILLCISLEYEVRRSNN